MVTNVVRLRNKEDGSYQTHNLKYISDDELMALIRDEVYIEANGEMWVATDTVATYALEQEAVDRGLIVQDWEDDPTYFDFKALGIDMPNKATVVSINQLILQLILISSEIDGLKATEDGETVSHLTDALRHLQDARTCLAAAIDDATDM